MYFFCTKHGCSINWSKAFYCGVNRAAGVYGTSGQATIGSCQRSKHFLCACFFNLKI
ncbi:leucocin A/sakacin P family class II bacteriocin [Pediococcus ethanolidurans]|uniref:leucocin A/sakacin P family class II bacteriocin n=1 Tax=Pediococcus ethanolidurans TaxID=319653 RepID=UPI001F032AA4|nr:leucocin A/sakacin P family class II bacteriocin [Pediococcus ethanolidurans]MCV3554736.1 leucocin A/sakacin P family class II bacteriocin [Pediococcus ethanolidurans]